MVPFVTKTKLKEGRNKEFQICKIKDFCGKSHKRNEMVEMSEKSEVKLVNVEKKN